MKNNIQIVVLIFYSFSYEFYMQICVKSIFYIPHRIHDDDNDDGTNLRASKNIYFSRLFPFTNITTVFENSRNFNITFFFC